MLTAEDLWLRFGAAPVLTGAALQVGRSEVVAITGPSGSGKSTLLACLAGLIVPDSGRVVFDGLDLAALSAAQRSKLRLRRFGFVFQFGDLVPELSLVENVELPLRFAGMGASEARRHAFDALELTGIGGLADRRIFEVSGGEQQRAAVARALVHSPDIVFADEPTGALDEENGALVLELFLAAARARAASVVMATHNPAIALGATRRVALRAGNVEITA